MVPAQDQDPGPGPRPRAQARGPRKLLDECSTLCETARELGEPLDMDNVMTTLKGLIDDANYELLEAGEGASKRIHFNPTHCPTHCPNPRVPRGAQYGCNGPPQGVPGEPWGAFKSLAQGSQGNAEKMYLLP